MADIIRMTDDIAKRLLTEAVAWFDECRPQWGPGTLPIWYVDAKRFLALVIELDGKE